MAACALGHLRVRWFVLQLDAQHAILPLAYKVVLYCGALGAVALAHDHVELR
jgi:hypothetical protein